MRRGTSLGRYHPLLGTNVEIRVDAVAESIDQAEQYASVAEDTALEEMVRLQAVFSVFDPDSELSRWRVGGASTVSAELRDCLGIAEHWWHASGGAFHPASASLRTLWLKAEADQQVPIAHDLAAAVTGLATLPFAVRNEQVKHIGDCSHVDLNAIAKGYIVDRAVAGAARLPGVVDVLINAGGDLRHEGDQNLTVGVEDPADPGGAPVVVVELGAGALATSGSVHRGFRIAGTWHSHVLDPRTGRPVDARPSTTVRAGDAATADAVATVVNVLGWPTAEPIIAGLPDVAVLTIDASGTVSRGGGWDSSRPMR